MIERVDPGQACSASRLCQGQSYCVQRVCTCISNFVQEGNQCVQARTVLVGSTCANGEACGENAYCNEAKVESVFTANLTIVLLDLRMYFTICECKWQMFEHRFW